MNTADPLDPRYRVLVDALDEGFVFMDRDRRVVFSNPAASRILGLPPDGLLGLTAGESDWTFAFEDGPCDADNHPSVIAFATREPVSNVVMHVTPTDGRGVWVSLNARPVFEGDDPVPSGVVVSFTDVSEQMRTRRALRESVERFRMLFDGTDDAVQFFDSETLQLLDFNDANVRMYGYSREELAMMTIVDLSAEPDETRSQAASAVAGQTLRVPNRLHRRKDGTTFPVAISSGSFELDGQLICYKLMRDVSVRVAAEEAARQGEERLAALLRHSRDVVVVVDAEGTLAYVSPSAHVLFGLPSDAHLDAAVFDTVHPDDQERARIEYAKWIATSERRDPFELRVAHVDGGWRHLELVASNLIDDPAVRGIVLNVRDITERRESEAAVRASEDALRAAELESHRRAAELERNRLESELERAQRLESLGRLAGGVAHDFNNLLGVILNYAGFVAKRLDASDPIAADVAEIRRAAERATDLTKQLLLFGRREVVRAAVFDLNDVIQATLPMFRRTLGDVDLVVDLVPGSVPLFADRGQIEQVLMNLLLNARDATGEKGSILVSTARRESSDPRSPGWLVDLSVRDNGAGMTAEVLDHAFEPFFTTKSRDRGSGLGLASVHGIVTRAGGEVSILSEPGVGTRVVVSLTLAPVAASAAPSATAETVVVVDDEPEVRAATTRILREGGYRVVEARSGLEALARLQTDAVDASLLITDVVMPEMSGPELASAVKEARPDIKVLLMSGYSYDDLAADDELRCALLSKPFTECELLEVVGNLLDSAVVA